VYRARPSFYATVAVSLVLLLVASAAFAAPVTPDKVRDKIVRIIQQKWSCKNLDVKVVPFSNDALTQAGRFQAIVFQADAITHEHITVAPIYIKAFDVTIDIYTLFYKDKIRTTKRKNTIAEAKMSEADLNKLLQMKEMPIKNPRVAFGNNVLTFTGEYAAVFGHNLMMQAKLQIVDHRKINLVPTKVKVNGIPLPAGPVRSLLSKVNPLLDMSEMPLDPTLDTISITPTHIVMKG
jgi:hypothetical protein